MKIAILGVKTYPALFGADRVVENLLNYFDTKNEYYLYLTTIDNKNKQRSRNNIHFIYIPTVNNKYFKAPIFFFLSALHAVIIGKYDFVHIHHSDFGLFNLIVKLRYKIIGTSHGSAYLVEKWSKFAKLFLKISETLFLQTSNLITTVSKTQYESLKTKYNERIYYIPNGINAHENLHSEFDLSMLNVEPQKYYLFCAGRIDKTKGLHTLIDAYLNIRTDKKLLIIGDFNHDKNYSKFIFTKIDNNTNIVIQNRLFSKPELYHILKNCFAFIFPSEVEAMSMMLLEAISLKAPVICSNIPENIAIVGEHYRYIFENKATMDLKRILEEIEQNGVDFKVVEDLYQKVLKEYNWNKIAKEYETLYLKLYKATKK